jgi:putative glycosyltransferase (TIGR04372 family)
MEEGKKIQNSIGLGLDEPFVCIHNREAGYHKHIVNQKYRESQITSFLPAIEYLIKNKFRVVRIGDASMAPLPSIPGLIDLTQMRNKHPLTDIWMGTHCVFMMCHPSGPLSIPIAFNGPPVLIVNLVDHPTYPMHPQDRYILKPIRIRHQGGRLLDFNERMLVMRHHPRDKDFEYYGLDIHPNSADEILDATEEMVEDISKGNGVDRTTPLQRAFRQTARQWNRLYSTFRSFEPYYLFNMPLSNRYLERYAGLLVKESLTTGKTLFQEGKLDEAHTYFGDILQVNPENHEALNNMGTVFYAKGDLSAAETRFLKAFSFSPDDDDILLNLIDLYIGQKRWREAIPLLERYLTHQCSDYERLNQLAVAYMEYDASHKAVPILLRSLAIEPEQAIVHEALYTLQLMSPASPTRG